MFSGYAIDQHVRLGRNDGRVDETQEEEAAYERTYGVICSLWVLALSSLCQ